ITLECTTEEAALLLLRRPDVRHAPRGPEDLHRRLVDRLRVVGRPGLAVDAQPELLPDLEERNAFRMHGHERAGLRVAALAGLAVLHDEAAEAANLDALAAHESLGEALENLVHDHFRVTTREAGEELHHLVDQIALRHGGLSPLAPAGPEPVVDRQRVEFSALSPCSCRALRDR